MIDRHWFGRVRYHVVALVRELEIACPGPAAYISEEQLEQARASFNESMERERQAAAETCKAAEQHVTNLRKDLAEEQREHRGTREELRQIQERYDTLTEQAHGHAQRVHELTAERDDLLEECRRWRVAAEHQKSLAEKPVTLTVDRDEWRQRFETEPDGRPICVRCGRAWTPEEGIDAKVVPCRQCIPSAPDGV